MRFTRYFQEQVLRKRPYLRMEWIEEAVRAPVSREHQLDGRIRVWAIVQDDATGKRRALRVVLLRDGETVHNAFYDRDFEA